LIEHALSVTETTGFGSFQPLFQVYLGEAHLLAGRLKDALELAERALSFTREGGQRCYEAWALRLFGEATTHCSHPERSEDHYRDALALAARLGMGPLVAHCHLGLGRLYWRTRKRKKARDHLTTAATMYRAMDMRFWLEQAEAEMGSP
jgi:tetratricopeptide (TPR) repeat protein